MTGTSVLGRLRQLPALLTVWVLVFCAAGYVVCAALLISGDTEERTNRMDGRLSRVTTAIQRLVREGEGSTVNPRAALGDPFATSCPQFAVIPKPGAPFRMVESAEPCVDLDIAVMEAFVVEAINTETTIAGYVPNAEDRLVRFYVDPFRMEGRYVGAVVAMMDPTEELDAHRSWTFRVVLGGVLLLAAIGAGTYLLQMRAIRPAASALEQQETLLADTAHDLRTPVAALRALAEASLANPGQHSELLPRAVELSRRMGTIIDGVLMRARLAAGVEQLAVEPVWLDQLVAAVVEETPANGAEITVTTAPTKVSADPALVQRAVGNLLENALRHGRVEGKPAVVQVTVAGGRVIVADHGPGIDPSAARENFERFSSGGGSSGLGLAIVRWVAQAHGGVLRVYNSDTGGAIFELTLPTTGD